MYRQALDHMATRSPTTAARRRPASTSSATPSKRPRACTCGRTASSPGTTPSDENLHVEIAVLDASDERFVPGLKVTGTLIDPDGNEVGTHEHELLWHPMIYHYGRNWRVPADGEYTLKVHIDPPTFMRHDEVNGCRFTRAGRRHLRGRQGRARAGLTRARGGVGERVRRDADDRRHEQHRRPRAERVGDEVRDDEAAEVEDHERGRARRRRRCAASAARTTRSRRRARSRRAGGCRSAARRRSRAGASRRRRARSRAGTLARRCARARAARTQGTDHGTRT